MSGQDLELVFVVGHGSARLHRGQIRGVAQGTVPCGGVIGLSCILLSDLFISLLNKQYSSDSVRSN